MDELKFFNYNFYVSTVDCLTDLLKHGDDIACFGVYVIEKAMNACFDYVKTVDKNKTFLFCQRGQIDPRDFQGIKAGFEMQEMNMLKFIKSQIEALRDKVLPLYDLEGDIFVGDIEDMKNIVDFAFEVTATIYYAEEEGV